MSVAPYIPTQEADLVTWAENFSDLITANPFQFGLVAADAVSIANAVNPFSVAYAVALNPGTRTPVSVANKDTLRAAMLVLIRPYAQNVRNNGGVSSALKISLGLNVPSGARTPILVPATQPLLAVIAQTPGVLTLRFGDPNSPSTTRSKPLGARQVQINVAYALAPVVDVALSDMLTLTTRQPFAAQMPNAQVTKMATLWARWVGRSVTDPSGVGFGPWSVPITVVVT